MSYIYYPGCSLEGTAQEYNASTKSVLGALGVELQEPQDWTCCGASAAEATSLLLSLVLGARNLALGERMEEKGDFLIPCSACYLNLRRVEDHVQRDETLLPKINEALSEEGLQYLGKRKVRHLLDVLATDLGAERVTPLVQRPLAGLRVAPYYGCQALRPYATYDDPQQPTCMEPLIRATGANVHPWTWGAKCCGAALMNTKKNVALELTASILKGAQGADCIASVCPMCQMNLEAYQGAASELKGEKLSVAVVYLPQLLGLSLGIAHKELKLHQNLALTEVFREKVGM